VWVQDAQSLCRPPVSPATVSVVSLLSLSADPDLIDLVGV
jgi:hypothetical protein